MLIRKGRGYCQRSSQKHHDSACFAGVKRRSGEFGQQLFDTVCRGVGLLRSAFPREARVTVAIARDTQAAQEPWTARWSRVIARDRNARGLLVQLVERIHHLQDVATRSRHDFRYSSAQSGTCYLPVRYLEARRCAMAGTWTIPRFGLRHGSFDDLLVGGPHPRQRLIRARNSNANLPERPLQPAAKEAVAKFC